MKFKHVIYSYIFKCGYGNRCKVFNIAKYNEHSSENKIYCIMCYTI